MENDTPYKNNIEIHLNILVTYSTIDIRHYECTFSASKKFFPILQTLTEPIFGIKTQNKIIIACCILHTYLMSEDPNQKLIVDVQDELTNERYFQGHQYQREESNDTTSGEPIRDNIANSTWLDY